LWLLWLNSVVERKRSFDGRKRDGVMVMVVVWDTVEIEREVCKKACGMGLYENGSDHVYVDFAFPFFSPFLCFLFFTLFDPAGSSPHHDASSSALQ
jgi:hypothetical protein